MSEQTQIDAASANVIALDPRDEHSNLTHMRSQYLVVTALFMCVLLSASGCDKDKDKDSDTGDSSNDGAGDPGPGCELASMVELADADEVAPNGRTGSEILAAIPESFQTTLHWDLSNSTVEVKVQDAFGQSSTLNLTFTLPPDPKFYFEDRVAAPTPNQDVGVICDDYVKTTLDVTAETQDGALSLELPAVEVKLGPHDPSTGYWAKPFVLATRPLESPVVEFVSPVAQPADSEKHVAISFDDPGVTGAITVYATRSSKTYRIVAARW
ncbi:MAG: hypothetical protein R6X02_18360 [Enhygromyxa sp.]